MLNHSLAHIHSVCGGWAGSVAMLQAAVVVLFIEAALNTCCRLLSNSKAFWLSAAVAAGGRSLACSSDEQQRQLTRAAGCNCSCLAARAYSSCRELRAYRLQPALNSKRQLEFNAQQWIINSHDIHSAVRSRLDSTRRDKCHLNFYVILAFTPVFVARLIVSGYVNILNPQEQMLFASLL